MQIIFLKMFRNRIYIRGGLEHIVPFHCFRKQFCRNFSKALAIMNRIFEKNHKLESFDIK